MKKIITKLLVLALAMPLGLMAADVKVTGLTTTSAVNRDDLFLITVDPSGAPISRAINGADLFEGLLSTTNRAHSFSVAAGAMTPEETDGATATTVEEGNYNTVADFLEFEDTGSNGVQFTFILPDNWDLGSFKIRLYHSTTNDSSAQTNVFEVSAKAIGPNESFTNTAWGTAVTVTNHITSSNTWLRTSTMTITAGNTPAAGDIIHTRIRRLPDHSHDVLLGRSRLKEARIQWTDDGTVEAPWN